MTTDDHRLATVEQTLAHQDRQIQDLSDMVTRQWREIDGLKKSLGRTQQRLEDLESPSEDGDAARDRPPHY